MPNGAGRPPVLQELQQGIRSGAAEIASNHGVVLVAEIRQRLEPQGTVEALGHVDVRDTNADVEPMKLGAKRSSRIG
jgi:hypothetical protein